MKRCNLYLAAGRLFLVAVTLAAAALAWEVASRLKGGEVMAAGAEGGAPAKPVQIFQDFNTDPGWEGWQNRVVGVGNPTVTQDFGWSPGTHVDDQPGEIGGVIFCSTTPAHYALSFGKPLTFKEPFSASGKFAFPPGQKSGGAYIGFFNSTRQGWRPWNSLALRISLIGDEKVGFNIDYKNGIGNASGLDVDLTVPADGSVHTWELSYDPTARVDMTWPDPHMPAYLPTRYEPTEKILERAKKFSPDLTADRLHKMLNQARDQGLVGHWRRKGIDTYWMRTDAQEYKGRVRLRIDDGACDTFLIPGMMDAESCIDRFGLFDFQLYHGRIEMYVDDVKVNGRPIDLSQDPRWEGRGNRVTFVEPDFQEKMDFGYSQTNYAGQGIGEIGGRFWSTEIQDPMHGYYGDDIGRLTLDDPLSMTGTLYFADAGPDARVFIGWFNAAEVKNPMEGWDDEAGHPVGQSLGLSLTDNTSISHTITAHCAPTFKLERHLDGSRIAPMRERRPFSLSYDPAANNGVGRITFGLDDEKTTLDLTPEQRKAGAVFDRFGITNVRRGGKNVDIYFDDISYTTGRPKGSEPVRHKQEVITYPYPRGGRAM